MLLSAGRKFREGASSGVTQRSFWPSRGWGIPVKSSTCMKCRLTCMSGYSWKRVFHDRRRPGVMPSSSCSSRHRASSIVSPCSRLPPGNSQKPAFGFPFGLRAARKRPCIQIMPAATSRVCMAGVRTPRRGGSCTRPLQESGRRCAQRRGYTPPLRRGSRRGTLRPRSCTARRAW